MNECSAYVGLDVHKDTIAVALPGRGEAVYRGEIKAQGAAAVQAIAWAAQKRLCARYRRLCHAGKAKCQVTTAVACEVMGRPHTTRALG